MTDVDCFQYKRTEKNKNKHQHDFQSISFRFFQDLHIAPG